jgi:hypothetical protein
MKSLFTRIRNWFVPPPPPKPGPLPLPVPDLTIPTPGPLQWVNYMRALLILRNTPFKELHKAFSKLPHAKIAYTTGAVIWLVMTYKFLQYLFGR